MKTSWFLKTLSHLMPVRMEQSYSKLNGQLYVDLVDGRFQLSKDNAIYSFEDKYTSYKKALEEADILREESALILGLGLGSIPYILHSQHQFSGHITCIDIDENIIQLAEKYYPDEAHWHSMTILEADAVQYLQTATDTFGLIAMDLFVGDEIPYACWETDFLHNLKKLAIPGGSILISRLIDRQMEEEILWNNLKLVFPDAKEVHTGGNMILIWKNEH